MKIQPCTVAKKNPLYIRRLRRNYVGIIQSFSWVLRKNGKKWEISSYLRYVSGIPGLPWLAHTPFLIPSSPCSSLSAVSCAALVEDVLGECLSLWLFFVGSFSIDRRWRGKKGCGRAGCKEQRTSKLLQGNLLYMRSVVS